jgi:hypothetical protein
MIVGQIEPFQTDCLDEQDALIMMTAANVKKAAKSGFHPHSDCSCARQALCMI